MSWVEDVREWRRAAELDGFAKRFCPLCRRRLIEIGNMLSCECGFQAVLDHGHVADVCIEEVRDGKG